MKNISKKYRHHKPVQKHHRRPFHHPPLPPNPSFKSHSLSSTSSSHATQRSSCPPPPKTKPMASPTSASASSSSLSTSHLPVHAYRAKLVKAVQTHPCVIISGDTGSGKTTQVPQFLMDDLGYTSIAITQPRRISAISLAHRVCRERGVDLGQEVGYAVRFDEKVSKRTQLKYVTDGMLLRELQFDPWLQKYQVVILDEAHERSVRTDVLIGLMKLLMAKRSQFKVIVMSATLEAELFAKFFNGSYALSIPGRLHEIRVFHTTAPVLDYVDASLRTIYQIHHHQPEGDILAFYNGQEDIEAAMTLLKDHAQHVPNLVVVAMFANLPLHLQHQVFVSVPKGHRKVVLATNIAETSITLPGVKYVVDHGLAKQTVYHPQLGLSSLMVLPISKANALQRAGRAGREGPGRVYRLYTDRTFQDLPAFPTPEILRADLAQVVLQLSSFQLAGDDVPTHSKFEFIQPPDHQRWAAAYRQLVLLGAMDTNGVTALGHQLLRYPLSPRLAAILVHARPITMDLLSLIALMANQDTLFYTPTDDDVATQFQDLRRRFVSSDGDLLTWLNVLKGYEEAQKLGTSASFCEQYGVHQRHVVFVQRVRDQVKQLCPEDVSVTATTLSASELIPPLLHGLFTQLAFLQPDGRYKTSQGQHLVKLHPSSVLAGQKVPVVCFLDFVGNESNQWYIRGISKVDPAWLHSFSQHVTTEHAVS